MAVTTTNLGVITAYGDAVAAGYTGTKAEWQALMASYATVGQQAVDAKNAAVAAKDTAVSKATEATTAANTATTKANEASASAQSIEQSASQITQNTSDISELKEELTLIDVGQYVVTSVEQGTTSQGNPVANATRVRSGLIPFRTGYKVIFGSGANVSNIAVETYNASGTWTGEQAWLSDGATITASANGFWRFVYRKSDNSNITPSEYDATTTIYATASLQELAEDVSDKIDADYSKNICNAFDPDNVVDNTYTNYNAGRITSLANWCSIQFKIDGGKKIATNVSGAHICFFSVRNDITNATLPSVLSGYISGATGILSGFDVPSNATYAVISIPISEKNKVQVEYGTTKTSYVPYCKGIDASKVIGGDLANVTEYNIYADGSGDFANLRACFESIIDSSKQKQYVVNVYPGTYDVGALYSDYTNRGLTIPDYTTLRGVGDKHNIIITAELDAQTTSFSTLNIKDVCTIENLTLKSVNCRYTVHDDYQSAIDVPCIRHIKDVIFYGDKCGYGSVYGSGLKGSAVWNFENCEFHAETSAANGTPGNAFSVHNNNNVKTPSFITFRNCRLINGSQSYKTVRLQSMTTGSENGTVTVTFEGCKVDGIHLGENNASRYGAGICFWVNGYGNVNPLGVAIVNTDEVDYSGNVDLI